jgi:hypothetical protein
MEKYGFIYLWYDKKHKMYYLGCHWGTENDGYICSSNRMRDAYRRRPQDFKRRIIQKNILKENLLSIEHKWLSLIDESELQTKYYNRYTTNTALRLAWAASKGRKQTQEEISKRVTSNTGKKRTEETKRKISESNKGKVMGPLSEEHKQKLSVSLSGKNNPFYGKQHDPEKKKEMSAKASATLKGKKPKNLDMFVGSFWWNNGMINKRSKLCPGNNWTKGKLKKV